MRRHDLLHHHIQIRAGLLYRDSRLQSRDLIQIMNAPRLRGVFLRLERVLRHRESGARRDPQFGLRRKRKFRRHNALDREWLAVNRDGRADNSWIAAEAPLPKRVAQYCLSAAFRRIRSGQKTVTQTRRHSQQRYQIWSCYHAPDSLRRPGVRERQTVSAIRSELFEGMILRRDIQKIAWA